VYDDGSIQMRIIDLTHAGYKYNKDIALG